MLKNVCREETTIIMLKKYYRIYLGYLKNCPFSQTFPLHIPFKKVWTIFGDVNKGEFSTNFGRGMKRLVPSC